MSRLYYEYDTMSTKEYNYQHIETVCPECNNNNIIIDAFHQETYCTQCGLILKDNTLFKLSNVIRAEENKNQNLHRFWRETNRQIKLKKIRDIYKVKK